MKKASGAGKKRKKYAEEQSTAEEPTSSARITDILEQQDSKTASKASTPQPQSGTATPKTIGIKNAATASLTAKVLEEQDERNKRRRIEKNKNLDSLFSSGRREAKDIDFMNRGFAIPSKR